MIIYSLAHFWLIFINIIRPKYLFCNKICKKTKQNKQKQQTITYVETIHRRISADDVSRLIYPSGFTLVNSYFTHNKQINVFIKQLLTDVVNTVQLIYKHYFQLKLLFVDGEITWLKLNLIWIDILSVIVIINTSFHHEENQKVFLFSKKGALFWNIPFKHLTQDFSATSPWRRICLWPSSVCRAQWCHIRVSLLLVFLERRLEHLMCIFFLKDSLFLLSCKCQRESPARRQISERDIFFLRTWLEFKLVSQSSEGDNDLLSVQPHNNKITSLPSRCGLWRRPDPCWITEQHSTFYIFFLSAD